MTPARLREIARQLEKIGADAAALAEELQSEISEAASTRDPLALHILRARKSYRVALSRDGKGCRSSSTARLMTYQRACELGFEGTIQAWTSLLGAGAGAV